MPTFLVTIFSFVEEDIRIKDLSGALYFLGKGNCVLRMLWKIFLLYDNHKKQWSLL